jgi:signal transduction histidine kinase
MKKSEINRIDTFVQVNKEIYQQEGNGLGLAIVKKILKMINGEVIIDNIENKYTSITVVIPLVPNE